MASLLIGVFVCVVISAGAVSVTVDTKGAQQMLPESTEKQIIRKEDKGQQVLGPTGARASVAGSWKPRLSYAFNLGSDDDEAAMRQSIENTIHRNSTYSFAQRAMRRSNAQKALASKRTGSNKTKREEDDCVNIFHADPPDYNGGLGVNCKEGENIKPGTSCTWDAEGASPQVSECKCEPKWGITVCELTPRKPVLPGYCWIGKGSPCKTRTIDHNKNVIASGESCKWEDPDLCPGAVPAEAKCKCDSAPTDEFTVHPECTIEFPKCKQKCEAILGTVAKCKEADAKGTILEDTQCTLECLGSGETADPKQSTCTCSEALGGCVIVPSEIKCEKTMCFPASAMILQPNGIETNVASLKQGDSVVGVTREWELQDDTYLAEFHAGQSRQHSMHKFIEVQHLCQMGRPLRVTAGHLLYAREAKQVDAQPELMPAGKLQPGIHEVFAIGCDKSQPRERLAPSLVLNITSVWAEGLYNPLTASRTAIVDGVATSNLALTSESIETAFNSSPFVRSIYEPAAWLLVAPVHLCAMLGLSTSWLSNSYLQDVVSSGLEKIAQLALYAA